MSSIQILKVFFGLIERGLNCGCSVIMQNQNTRKHFFNLLVGSDFNKRIYKLPPYHGGLDDALAQDRAEEVHEEDQEVRPHRRLLHPSRL